MICFVKQTEQIVSMSIDCRLMGLLHRQKLRDVQKRV